MKKYIYSLFLTFALVFGLASCAVETDFKPGGTVVQEMCGYWVVTVDALDPDTQEVLLEDPYHMGKWYLVTSNTSDDTDDEIMITESDFWGMNFRVNCDLATKTFSCEEKCYDPSFEELEEGSAIVSNGIITVGTAKGVHGGPIDEISFDVFFNDDDYGFLYRIHGVRYEGF